MDLDKETNVKRLRKRKKTRNNDVGLRLLLSLDDLGRLRHPNDTFLANLDIPRIRGTDIVLGLEYGFVCFEIPKGAEGLRFVADEGNIFIKVNVD